MSRLAKIPLPIPPEVKVAVTADGTVTVTGKLGELSMAGNDNIAVTIDDNKVRVSKTRDTKHARSLEGTYVRCIANMVTGVTVGCTRQLELRGTGYRANIKGNILDLELGFSHAVIYELPQGITAEITGQDQIVIRGIDNILVGQVAAEIRAKRPPDAYKGKGVRYVGEQVIMKETKKK